MERLLHLIRANPLLAGLGFGLCVVVLLAVVLGVAMHKAGLSLRPLIFFFGFFFIVAGPQAVVHLLNARLTANPAKSTANVSPANTETPTSPATPAAIPGGPALAPISWETVFGPDTDPALIVDAKRGLEAILADASEARIAFNTRGESALAARFASPDAAAAALNRYGSFFRFVQVTGNDAFGWTARRHAGQGEWNHVVTAGNELYAWSAASRETVVAERIRALGTFPDVAPTPAAPAARPSLRDRPANEPATNWLRDRPAILAAFLIINLLAATLWFFKVSAWSGRTDAVADVAPLELAALRDRLLAVNHGDTPVEVTLHDDGRTMEVNWRYADARWFDLMSAHRMRRTHRLVLRLDESSRKVRVTEFWSAFDASARPDSLRLSWKAASGMQFFNFEKTTVLGAQIDPAGSLTGELAKTFTFDLQAMKNPVISAVTGAGWHWQPVMWDGPASLRWLTE